MVMYTSQRRLRTSSERRRKPKRSNGIRWPNHASVITSVVVPVSVLRSVARSRKTDRKTETGTTTEVITDAWFGQRIPLERFGLRRRSELVRSRRWEVYITIGEK